MLHELHIRNYAVVENLALEFRPGLNLLSGETGSGKSILVDALELALGGRASPDVIRSGADRATVIAIFRCGPARGLADREPRGRVTDTRKAQTETPPWARWFEEYGLAGADEQEIILRREIQQGGKSRLLLNDQPVTTTAVRELARQLVEIHGQNEHVSLLAPESQLELLDQFGGLEGAVEEVRALFGRYRELERELGSLSTDEQHRLHAIDLLTFQLRELDAAGLRPGEDTLLENERQVLANAEKIRAAASSAFIELYEDERSACSRLGKVARALEELRGYDARFDSCFESLVASRAALEDVAIFLRDYTEKLESDPGRLEEVEDRLALIDKLKRKYGSTIEEIQTFHDQSRDQLSGLANANARRGALELEVERAAEEYGKVARALSEKRRSAARKLVSLVRDELGQLGMEKARFEIQFAMREAAAGDAAETAAANEPGLSCRVAGGPRGCDQVEFRISPNPGEELRRLEKIASGGELSRLMLALKTVVGTRRPELPSDPPQSGRAAPPTFIFDEVDAGIGGRVAEQVGQRLKRLSRNAQVLCVTHLPQIACFADHHFYVEKSQRGGRTLASVRHLESSKERAQELARMLSGSQITDAVLKHAAAMLKQAEVLT